MTKVRIRLAFAGAVLLALGLLANFVVVAFSVLWYPGTRGTVSLTVVCALFLVAAFILLRLLRYLTLRSRPWQRRA